MKVDLGTIQVLRHQRDGWVGLKSQKHDDVILEWSLKKWNVQSRLGHANLPEPGPFLICLNGCARQLLSSVYSTWDA